MTANGKKLEKVLFETVCLEAQLKKSIQEDRKVIKELSK
jgi:hypothetical protein